ncbi:MAG TPA: hypothetical protein PKE45_04470 [Caldilineaceae bacterium]|nr:hypothetical protein [Caldilineaceae bacterium]
MWPDPPQPGATRRRLGDDQRRLAAGAQGQLTVSIVYTTFRDSLAELDARFQLREAMAPSNGHAAEPILA